MEKIMIERMANYRTTKEYSIHRTHFQIEIKIFKKTFTTSLSMQIKGNIVEQKKKLQKECKLQAQNGITHKK